MFKIWVALKISVIYILFETSCYFYMIFNKLDNCIRHLRFTVYKRLSFNNTFNQGNLCNKSGITETRWYWKEVTGIGSG